MSTHSPTVRLRESTTRTPAIREHGRLHYGVKRTLDLVGASLGLLVLLPLLVICALLIKIESRGPVIFVQSRVGARQRARRDRAPDESTWELRPFRFYKFRTMVHNADPTIHETHIRDFVTGQPIDSGVPGARFKLASDPRVTRIGMVLRRTSLDEVPQLFNVLRGQMSLVGPRPVPIYEAALYADHHLARFRAKPGITGLWQVNGRSDVSFDEMMQLDLAYVQHESILLDLKILIRTGPAVLRGRGAA
jgi:lipopolysaccharide/colanic/teichoic acid biosynthesis glycosyltransferase